MRVFILARFAAMLFVTGLIAGQAQAAQVQPFDQSQFVAAQNDGKPILVDIAASWCPTCQAQKPIIESLMQKPEFANLVIFQVDFDKQAGVVRQMHASAQSTLITFHGTAERARSVGDTEQSSIELLLQTALAK